jgi:hypothetical protein
MMCPDWSSRRKPGNPISVAKDRTRRREPRGSAVLSPEPTLRAVEVVDTLMAAVIAHALFEALPEMCGFEDWDEMLESAEDEPVKPRRLTAKERRALR